MLGQKQAAQVSPSATAAIVSVPPRDYDAALFDMDGVLTRTASVHSAAWKRLFDEFLEARARAAGEAFAPFDPQADYRRYVDGKPRRDGVRDFLASRGIVLDAAGVETLAERKDRYFNDAFREHGVEVFEDSIALVRALRAEDVRVGVVSSSRNCAAVLEAAGIAGLFEARVDGLDDLPGKPAPDAFLEGARRLGAEPARTLVVEDAVAGVASGRAGGFGLVVGVDRGGNSAALREAGADVVVKELGEISLATESLSAWSLEYDCYDAPTEGRREALCALGNGYFTTRGCLPWARADGIHYPGTYLAGGYNRLRTAIGNRVVENEDLVNLPDWCWLELALAGEALDLQRLRVLEYRQALDLRRGMLTRCLRVADGEGRITRVEERRFVSMARMHVAALELAVTPENWDGEVAVRSGVDARIVNAGAKLYREFSNRHLEALDATGVDGETVALEARTTQSHLHVAIAARTRAFVDDDSRDLPRTLESPGDRVAHAWSIGLRRGERLRLEKVAALHTSRDAAISECALASRKAIARAPGFEALLAAHVLAWKHLWRRFDMHLQPAGSAFRLNVPMLLRLNILHLLQAVSPNTVGLDAGVPARGWTGEAYQGHVFWDELFIFPTLNLRAPEITRSLLMYRYRRLDEARAAARAAGHAGAMFPWQSGSDGQEETQEVNLNHRSRRWIPDNSYLQRHVGAAIAWNAWQYYQVTRDTEFLEFEGAELILEIARFWSSAATFDAARKRYVIRGVMGPDEFHEAYPDAEAPGLDNNAYTNVMAAWVLRRAADVLALLPDLTRAELLARLDLDAAEVARWSDIAQRMFVPFHGDGIISQFEGYEKLEELDWDHYRARYGNIQRMELILEAEDDTANRYKLSKQADVLMLFYLFSPRELEAMLGGLGYDFPPGMIPRNVAYYEARSAHGSTLSRVVHAWVLARHDRARAMHYFAEALQSDVADIQGGTTAEGIHLGAMAGSVDLALRVASGLEIRDDILHLDPSMPAGLRRLDMRIRYRGFTLDLRLAPRSLTVRARQAGADPIRIAFRGAPAVAFSGGSRTFEY